MELLNFLKDYKDALSIILSAVGVSFTIIISIYQKILLDKRKYALEMINEWNKNTSHDTSIIRKFFVGCYEECKVIDFREQYKHIILSFDNESEEVKNVRDAIIRLLNYFEYIASAYLNKGGNRKIINNSFTGTMIRYYVVLELFIITEHEITKRNPWLPYTIFIEKQVKKAKQGTICKCRQECRLKTKKELLKTLRILNSLDVEHNNS